MAYHLVDICCHGNHCCLVTTSLFPHSFPNSWTFIVYKSLPSSPLKGSCRFRAFPGSGGTTIFGRGGNVRNAVSSNNTRGSCTVPCCALSCDPSEWIDWLCSACEQDRVTSTVVFKVMQSADFNQVTFSGDHNLIPRLKTSRNVVYP